MAPPQYPIHPYPASFAGLPPASVVPPPPTYDYGSLYATPFSSAASAVEPVVRTERDEIKLARIREMTRLGTGHAPAPDVPPSEVPLSADTVCAVCNVRERTHIFAPCGHHLACEPCATRIMDTTRTCPHHDCAKPILMFMRLFPGGYVSPKTPSPDESADDASPHVSTANSMRSANSYGSDMNSSGSDNDGSPEQSRRATPTAELSTPPPPSARAPGH